MRSKQLIAGIFFLGTTALTRPATVYAGLAFTGTTAETSLSASARVAQSCDSENILQMARSFNSSIADPNQQAHQLLELSKNYELSCRDHGDAGTAELLKQMALRASLNCVALARKEIRSAMEDADISSKLPDLRFCAESLGTDPESLSRELKRLEKQNQEKRDQRKAECSDVNVDLSAMGPVRDQGDIGWCYAHAAADLISFKLGRRISAIDLAMNYNDGIFFRMEKAALGRSEFSREGGTEKGAVLRSLDKGFCAEEDFHDQGKDGDSAINVLRAIERLRGSLDKERYSPAEICAFGYDRAVEFFGNLRVEDFADILYHYSQGELYNALRNVSCRNRITLKKGSLNIQKTDAVFSTAGPLGTLDKVLEKGQPVGIEYQTKLLGGRWSAARGAHANTIVGRHFNPGTGECQYRLRNTWGTDWGSDGYKWVSRSAIRQNVLDFTYLE